MRQKYVLSIILVINICCMFVYGDSDKIKNPANGHWYQRFDTPMSWHQAKAYCESLGGHLATITSAEENNFVYLNVVVNPLSQVLECWLGATDEEYESIWKWVTGETWNYTNWGYGEPNSWQGNEDYLTIFTTVESQRFSKWNDRGNNYNYSTICEWEAEKQTITVTSPNGGERWTVNDNHSIKWTTKGSVRNVKIEYTTDNGAT
ncbi:MAG: C-type lectin domain-containing protein [Candidatus Aminicenantes bacterium]|nr:C-type lectin domain-containing protein [Candidatus Aminicenantes bacterium]